GRVFVYDVIHHLLEQRGVAVGQPDLESAGIVDVLVDGPGRRVPNIVLFVADDFAVDASRAAAADAEVHLRRIVADRFGALSGFQDAEGDGCTGSQAVADTGHGIDDRGNPAAVFGRRQGGEAVDFSLDGLLRYDDCRDQIRRRCGGPG